MKVEVYLKSVYGQELIYPANSQAKLFLELTGRKTFSMGELATIRKLGFEVCEVPNPKKQPI